MSDGRDPAAPQRFADCEIDRGKRTLRRGGRVVPLQPRPFDLLLYLIDHRDRVVPQAEIMRAVWVDVHVNDQSLRYALHSVRRAIGDRGDRQQIVRTYPRQGLRFVATILESGEGADGPAPGRATSGSPFCGRGRVLREVRDVLSAIRRAGRPRVLLVSGEAGIGKTSTLEQVSRYASEMDFLVAHARCDAALRGPAYWPWTQALRVLIREAGAAPDLEAVVASSPEVGWALPELVSAGGHLKPPIKDAPSARYRLFEAVTGLLRALSRDRPIAICLDDLHEADEDTLLLACDVAGGRSCGPVLLAASFRDPCEAASARFQERISRLAAIAEAASLPLGGLAIDDFRALLLGRFGVVASDEVVRDLHDRTAGNPFFLVQLVTLIREDDRLAELSEGHVPRVRIPRHVKDAIVQQVDWLSTRARGLVETASVIGNEFSVSLLALAAGVPESDALSELDGAHELGIVSDSETPGISRFVHPLVREALYAGLTAGERRDIHHRVALALEAIAGDDPGPQSAELARHFSASAPHADAAKAIGHYVAASERDIERAAFDAGCARLEAAMALAESLLVSDKEVWSRLWLRLGIVHGWLSHREESRRALSKAAEHASMAGRDDIVCEAALAFSPDLLAIETGVYDAELVRLLRRAIGSTTEQSASIRSRLLARLAVALHWSPDASGEIPALVEEARSTALASGDLAAQRFADTAGRLALYSPGARVPGSRRVRVSADGDASTVLMDRILWITRLMEAGDIRAVEAEVNGLDQLVESLRKKSATWYGSMLRSTLALMRGQYGRVRKLCDVYLRQGEEMGDRNALHSFALQRAMMAVDMGDLEDSEGSVARMASSFPVVEGWEAGLCFLQSEIGSTAEASERLDRLIEARVLSSAQRNSWLGTIGCLALAIRNLGRIDLAETLYELWLPHAGHLVVVGFGSFCWGAADRFLGVLAGMMGRWDAAGDHFDAATSLNERCGALPALAQTHRDRARQAGRHDAEAARESWERAFEISNRLGMTGLTARLLRDREAEKPSD